MCDSGWPRCAAAAWIKVRVTGAASVDAGMARIDAEADGAIVPTAIVIPASTDAVSWYGEPPQRYSSRCQQMLAAREVQTEVRHAGGSVVRCWSPWGDHHSGCHSGFNASRLGKCRLGRRMLLGCCSQLTALPSIGCYPY